MRISVIIPTYNRLVQVTRAIESVLAQTVKVDQIIVIDDGSTDGSAEAISLRYGPGVLVIRQDNAGVSSARNRGIREAEGDWIAFLDSDDVWRSTKMERQLEAMMALGGEFGACFTNGAYTGNPNLTQTVFEEAGFEAAKEFDALTNQINYIGGKHFLIWPSSLVVSRALLLSVDGFDESMSNEEDIDLLFRLALATKFCFVSLPLIEIDRNPTNSRLTDAYTSPQSRFQHAEKLYGYAEYRLRKWMALPNGVDLNTRITIRCRQRDVYYGWAVTNLYKRNFLIAFEKIGQLRAMGISRSEITLTLLFRAMRKLGRSVPGLRTFVSADDGRLG